MTRIFSLLFTLTIAAASLEAKGMTIVQEGKPLAVIVFDPNNSHAAKAASEIQSYIKKMSDTVLPLRTIVTGDSNNQNLILVGRSHATDRLGIKIPAGFDKSVHADAFNEEGYVIKTIGSNIVVAGNDDGPYNGTLYAAYSLLEKLGCRWYFPGEWGEVIPTANSISLAEMDICSRPDFPIRITWLSAWVPITAEEREIYKDWCIKIGFSNHHDLGQTYPDVGDGYLAFLLPPDEYFEKHPEFYAMEKNGTRRTDKYPRFSMLCLSDPNVLQESINNIKACYVGKRTLVNVMPQGIGISPPDGTPYCYCDKCKARSQNFRNLGYVDRTMQSEEFFEFAAELARTFPDKWVSTMAYSLRELPPQGVDIPANLMVSYAPISSDILHSFDTKLWRRHETLEILKQWRQMTAHIMVRDYTPGLLTGMFVPERDLANMTVNIPIYKDIDIKGFCREGRKAFMQTWISYYISAKLMWNAHADVNELKHDFYTNFFGPQAGPKVQAWWDACEQMLGDSTIQAHEDFLINHLYTVAFTNNIHKYVEDANRALMTDAQRRHFNAFVLIADHLEAWTAMTDAEMKQDWQAASQAAARMIYDRTKLKNISPFFIDADENANVKVPYFAEGRKLEFEKLDAMTNGNKGTLVASLPLIMKFTRDPFNEGIINQWYLSDYNDSKWQPHNTFFLWDQQERPLDTAGHDYDGYGWYRTTISIPAEFKNKPIRFYCGGIINEGWIWINGRYVGHKEYHLWWDHDHSLEFDVARFIKPGQDNTITIRVWNDVEYGGLYRRGFFWSPCIF